MESNARIYVAGHNGLVGNALVRSLKEQGYTHIIGKSSRELDLREQAAVRNFFAAEKPDYVFLAAARVGGIYANASYPADFIRDNMQIEVNIIDAAYKNQCKKLLFLGSSCIYPKFAPQPMPEHCLLEGALEPTNQWYALAKIAGIRLCQAYRRQYGFDAISAMPTNLYGPGDNFHPENSHVIPALMQRFHEAKVNNAKNVSIWGTGTVYREFLHVDDMAEACIFLMNTYSDEEHVNVGVGKDCMLLSLAELLAEVVGFTGNIVPDPTKPDGTLRKLLDVHKINALGWKARISLKQGLIDTYAWFLQQQKAVQKGTARSYS